MFPFLSLSSPSMPAHARTSSRIAGVALALLSAALCSPLSAQTQKVQPMSSPKGITPNEVVTGIGKLVAPMDSSQTLRLVIALRAPHLAEEQKFVEDLRTKGTSSFGKFLTPEQFNQRFAPSKADEQSVVDWATEEGFTITKRYADRMLVDVEAPVATIEKALNLKINQYSVGGAMKFSSDRDPELPASMVSIVQNVQGLNNMKMMSAMHKGAATPDYPVYAPGPVAGKPITGGADSAAPKPKSLTSPHKPGAGPNITDGAYDPTDLFSSQAYDVQALYNQGHCCNPFGNSGQTPKETTIAIVTAGSQDPNDFAGFQNTYPYLAYHYAMEGIDGQSVPCNPNNTTCDGEGTLDFEWSTAMSNSFGALANTSLVIMYDAIDSNFGTFNDAYAQVLSDNSTRIMSVSYGCEEGPKCYDQTDMNTTDSRFMQLVSEGWTIVIASGDHGATASCDDDISVMFPASDPNVVGAGGTTLYLDSSSNFITHTAWSGGPEGCNLNNPRVNDGGSTGGVSQYWGTPSFQSNLGYPMRAVPDLALNADFVNAPQNIYYGGGLEGNGGTSIVAPELAGLFAQFNAYLLTLGDNCANEGGPCAPMGGLVDPMIYYLQQNPSYGDHYAFYDITEGCNNNDVTAFYDIGYYCAGTGYDPVTGMGSFNALQLAWSINQYRAGDDGNPIVSFSGPATSVWYNSNQIVSWSITDTSGLNGYSPNGVAGFSQGWDSVPSDPSSEAVPGSGNSFYSGPEFPNGTTGCLETAGGGGCAGGVSQGCHYAYVQAWDNSGFTGGASTYGPVCYDTTAPTTTATLSGTVSASHYNGPVKVTLSATDNLSGVHTTVYQVDGGSTITYTGPFIISTSGTHTVTFHSTDTAGNVESSKSVSFKEYLATTTTLTSSQNPALKGATVVFNATVTASSGTVDGIVELLDGTTVLQSATLSGGKVQFSVSNLAVGTHSLSADFTGQFPNGSSVSSVLSEVVKYATTTGLTTSLNPAPKGSSVTFTATVTSSGGTPTGSVQFKDGTTVIGTATLAAGKAVFATTSLPTGTDSITAAYEGSGTFNTSTSTAISEVIKHSTTTALTSSINPVAKGASVTFTATVTSSGGIPTGNVQFKDGTTVIGTVALNGSGTAAFTTSTLATGTHPITAFYESAATYYSSTSPTVNEVVDHTTTTVLTSSKNPAIKGNSVTFTATVTSSGGTPTGMVHFKDGTTILASVTLSSSGTAAYATTALAVGTHSITAVYESAPTFYGSTSPILKEVINN